MNSPLAQDAAKDSEVESTWGSDTTTVGMLQKNDDVSFSSIIKCYRS